MHRELDRFVDTDEKVRGELDRKDRVDYLKSKNEVELQKSTIKVRESLSPERRSAYKSPYKK